MKTIPKPSIWSHFGRFAGQEYFSADLVNFQWRSARKKNIFLEAHSLFCTSMWELGALKLTVPKTMEALRPTWSAYRVLKRISAQLIRKFESITKGSMSFRIFENDPAQNHGSSASNVVSLHGIQTKTCSA